MTTSRAAGTEATQATALFLGIGVGNYTHEEHFPPLPAACSEVQEVAELLANHQFRTQVIPNPGWADALATLDESLSQAELPQGSCLVVLWSGHGEMREEGLHLVSSDCRPHGTPYVTTATLLGAAVRSGAAQILVLLDTCHSGAGAINAIELASKIRTGLPNDGSPRWIGILPSALEHERAQEGIFGSQLMRLLREGPSDPELRLRWSAHNAGVRGDDLIDVMVKEWGEEEQSLEPVITGNAQVMFPNPRFDPDASDQVVEHLLLVARGIEAGEEGDYFTGRVAPLSELVRWMEGQQPGLALVTGPAGCGKSALLGRLASLSDSRQRHRILALGPLEHPDPGEGSVAAQVQARALTADGLAGRIDGQLVKARLLAASAAQEPRNSLELQGALQRLRQRGVAPPLILIDGLEEAGAEAWAMAEQVIGPLAGLARVMVSSRPIPGRAGGLPLLESLGATTVINLGDLELQAQSQADVRRYVEKRLAGISK